ncbi:hypothetical protein SAMN05428941_4255 [Streptomyces sp. 2114.2]|nr:hypothetical protein SAMN05428941_4255 [Streptomyces sp. 2114.2]
MTCGIAGSLWRVVAGGACGGLRGVAGGARCLRRLCGFGGGARSAVCPVGGSGSRRGVSVLGTARNRLATGVRGVDAPTAAGGHPPTRPLLAVRGSPRQRSGYPSSPYAALPANAPGTPPRRTRLSPPSLRVPLLAVRGSPRHRSGYPSSPYAALPANAPRPPPRRTRLPRRRCEQPPRRGRAGRRPPRRRGCGSPLCRRRCGQSCRWGGTGGRSGTPQRRAALPLAPAPTPGTGCDAGRATRTDPGCPRTLVHRTPYPRQSLRQEIV